MGKRLLLASKAKEICAQPFMALDFVSSEGQTINAKEHRSVAKVKEAEYRNSWQNLHHIIEYDTVKGA